MLSLAGIGFTTWRLGEEIRCFLFMVIRLHPTCGGMYCRGWRATWAEEELPSTSWVSESQQRDDVVYTSRLHADIVEAFIEKLDLKNLILVLHEWGGPLGAAYAVNHPDNVWGLAFMETFVWPYHGTTSGGLRQRSGYCVLRLVIS